MSQKYYFPLKKRQGDTRVEYTYEEIMERVDSESGCYLLGTNGKWHGGIHVKQALTSDEKVTDREPVYAIGKGRVIAYRLAQQESVLQVADDLSQSAEPNDNTYSYSTSFVLIKHELRVKPEEEETEEASDDITRAREISVRLNEQWGNQNVTVRGREQTIYHSFDLNTFNQDPLKQDTSMTITRVYDQPFMIQGGMHYIVVARREDGTDEWFVGFDAEGNIVEIDGDPIIVPINEHSEVETLEDDENDDGIKLITFYSLYMHLADYEEYEKTELNIEITASRVNIREYNSETDTVDLTSGKGMAKKGEKYTVIGDLFYGTQDTNQTIKYAKIEEDRVVAVSSGENIHAKEQKASLTKPAYWSTDEAPTRNSVVVCDIPVEAGDLIGHLGRFDTPQSNTGGVNSKYQVHIEVFTEDNDAFERFYRNDRDLYQDQKYIRLRDGYVISTQMSETVSATNQVRTVVGEHVVTLALSDEITDEHGNQYYRLLNLSPRIFGREEGSLINGYIRIDHLRGTGVFCQHDWDQLGFNVIREADDNADGFIDVEETPQFFQDIYQTITQTALPDENDELLTQGSDAFNLAALRFKLRDSLFRDRWSKLIAKHPTEWEVGGDHGRWDHLDELFSNVTNGEYFKTHERERINHLVFWDELGENKPPQTNLLHFHPMAFVNNIKGKPVCPIDPEYRSHFVIHSTAVTMSKKKIQSIKNRSKAHKYIMKDGEIIVIWPFTEKNVWATKIESHQNLKGRMFHVELNYEENGAPTVAQYLSLAKLYKKASDIEGCWPIIVPHIEVDRGIADGHRDPENFDYDYFYNILRNRGVPIDDIPHFEHDRYWSYPASKMPWPEDKNSWPPVLKGNPHK